MLDHHLQRSIMEALAHSDGLRFSELQPSDVENKLFTYHLKKVVQEGYIVKSDDGIYSLTSEGRRIWKTITKKQASFIDRAYSLLFLIVRRKDDGAWLLFTRNSQPFLNQTGLMQAHPHPMQSVQETAAKACLANTGLSATFNVVTSGYFSIFQDDIVESFTHFTLLASDDATGELSQNDEFGTYAWQQHPDLASGDVLPTVQVLIDAYLANDSRLIERTFTL